ncbi:nucleoplasmin-like protein NO29 [Acropora millepora]|uniref:nucleoplasmin-like protein NO29 n=1 Tax=Acropora millepora TaxID=45264 RepID=UPI001CF5D4CF|nr:nucleoplasmin-like protein NO29 [Acropora millepora]
MMGHYRRAIEDLKMVLEDDPGNKEAERELLECQHCQMFVCDTHWFYFSDPKLSALDKKGGDDDDGDDDDDNDDDDDDD